jgi:hypothetical protein
VVVLSWADSLFLDPDENYKPRTVADIHYRLKQVDKQVGRFFVKLDEFNRAFFKEFSNRQFIESNYEQKKSKNKSILSTKLKIRRVKKRKNQNE